MSVVSIPSKLPEESDNVSKGRRPIPHTGSTDISLSDPDVKSIVLSHINGTFSAQLLVRGNVICLGSFRSRASVFAVLKHIKEKGTRKNPNI